jgi:hypothetical protein
MIATGGYDAAPTVAMIPHPPLSMSTITPALVPTYPSGTSRPLARERSDFNATVATTARLTPVPPY